MAGKGGRQIGVATKDRAREPMELLCAPTAVAVTGNYPGDKITKK